MTHRTTVLTPRRTPPRAAAASELVPNGAWGDDHVVLTVTDNGGRVEFDCAHGTLDHPLRLDDRGRFSVPGTFVPERGGPRAAGRGGGGRARALPGTPGPPEARVHGHAGRTGGPGAVHGHAGQDARSWRSAAEAPLAAGAHSAGPPPEQDLERRSPGRPSPTPSARSACGSPPSRWPGAARPRAGSRSRRADRARDRTPPTAPCPPRGPGRAPARRRAGRLRGARDAARRTTMPTLACGHSTVPLRSMGRAEGGLQAIGDARGIRGLHVDEQDRELVGSEAHEGVAAPETGLEPARRGVEQPVAGGVAETLVGGAEPVEVDHRHRKRRALHGGVERILQRCRTMVARQASPVSGSRALRSPTSSGGASAIGGGGAGSVQTPWRCPDRERRGGTSRGGHRLRATRPLRATAARRTCLSPVLRPA